ncbi:hypothetical protein HpMS178_07260 [Helicobacter pylori]
MTVIQTLSQKLSPFFVKKLITTLMTKAIGNTNNIDKPPSKHPIAVFSIPSNKPKEIPPPSSKPLPRFYDNRFSHLFADLIGMH